MKVFLRLFLTGVLLVIVWLNAHWSVALAITLLTVNVEMSTLYVRRVMGTFHMFFPGNDSNGNQQKKGG